jgi:predicted ribosome quality control (RQC) complex YloA/Tae2 family protein
MPFDVLVMRAVTATMAPRLLGALVREVAVERDTVWIGVRATDGQSLWVYAALNPSWAHVRFAPGRPRTARAAPWAEALAGARIAAVHQPRFERVWQWDVEPPPAWEESGRPARVVFEWAGHLTNVLWLRADGTVGDAFRRVPEGRPGRAVWPGLPYIPPPPVPDPCAEENPAHLPPWAARWVAARPDAFRELCADYAAGRFTPWVTPGTPEAPPDIWVYPWTPAARPQSDWHRALAEVMADRERRLTLAALRRQVQAALERRQERLSRRLADAEAALAVDVDAPRRTADALLAWGSLWPPGTRPETVPDVETGEPRPVGWVRPDESYQEAAARLYRRYRKLRAAREQAMASLPAIRRDLARIAELLARAAATDDAEWLRELARRAGRTEARAAESRPFRRFVSPSGFEIWVGRNDAENDALTFRHGRPDDLWFHAKQYAGSHVLLRCAKSPVQRADLEAAAQLAAFYSRAGRSASVAVDYTPRKFVRRRPHAPPGQVLYTRERTLYVTPDPEQIRRLAEVGEDL